jgi:tetratricopeptide (TPR) repeat protein
MNGFSYYLFYFAASMTLSLALRHPSLLLLIGVAWLARGYLPDPYLYLRHRARIQRLTQDVDANPSNAASHRELAVIHLAKRQAARARPHIEAALQRVDSPELHHLRGLAALGEQRWQDAQEAFEAVVDRDPKFLYGDPYLRAGDAYLAEGRLEEALDAYLGAVDVNSSSVEGRYKQAEVHRRLGDRAEAERLLADALATYRQLPGFLRRQHRRWYARARLRSLLG